MKTIFKDGVYERVDNELGEFKVKHQGFKFVSKSEWKKNVRDATPKAEEVAVAETKGEETKAKKAAKHSKIKAKQRELEPHEKIIK